MRYRTFTAALAAAALICSPMPSFAQTAPQPAVSQESGLQLADYDADHPRKKRRLLLWILLGLAAVVVAYCIFKCGGDDDELPTSP